MATREDILEVYRSEDGQWRWRLKSSNGRKLSNPGEGYVNKAHAIKMAERVTKRTARVVE